VKSAVRAVTVAASEEAAVEIAKLVKKGLTKACAQRKI
jgi:hypothetical protein